MKKLLESDEVQVLKRTNDFIVDLWTDASCEGMCIEFKSACLRGPKQFFSISLKFCRLATIALKMPRAKGFFSQPSESAIPACSSKIAEKSPHI